MRAYTRSLLAAVSLLVLPLSAFTAPALAQTRTAQPSPSPAVSGAQPATGIDLSISPTFLSLTTDPGKSVTSKFTVRNNNNFTETLQISVAKFTAAANGSSPVIADLAPGDTFGKWVTITPQEFSVDANETKTITVEITPPKNAALGYYYALVIRRAQANKGAGQGAAITGAPALPVLLNVKSPNAKRELQIVDFKTNKMMYEYLPATFTVTLKNTGNIHVVPVGDIFIDGNGKKNLSILQVNTGKGNILPNSTRAFTASWADGFAIRVPKTTEDGRTQVDDKGHTEYQVKYDFQKADKFRMGKYTANLLMVYDNGERDVPIEAQISFWVIPWKILAIGGIVVILAVLGLGTMLTTSFRRVSKRSHG